MTCRTSLRLVPCCVFVYVRAHIYVYIRSGLLGSAGGLALSTSSSVALLNLGLTLRQNNLVLLLLSVLTLSGALLQAAQVSLALQALRCDQALNLGCLGVRLGSLLLGGDLTTDDELANIVLRGQVEELANVCERDRAMT